MIDLRAFAIIDQIQKQFAGYIGSTAMGYYPIAGQSAFFVEIAPGIEINSITNVVLKRANVKPGAMVVERTFGMLEVHGDSPADVREAADAVLEYAGMKEHDRIKPKILASDTIDRIEAHMTQIVNRFRSANMILEDDTRRDTQDMPPTRLKRLLISNSSMSLCLGLPVRCIWPGRDRTSWPPRRRPKALLHP